MYIYIYTYLIVGGCEAPPCVLVPPAVRCPLRATRGDVCPPVVGACPVCCPPCGGFLPRVLVPPRRGVVAPTETIAMTAERLQR